MNLENKTKLDEVTEINDIVVRNISKTSRINKFGQDPLEYYKQNYPGMTRGKLNKKDQSLYNRLRKDGLLEEVPIANRIIENPLEYYRQNYLGMTRGKLEKKDESLYQRLRKDGLLEEVPLKLRKYGI